MQGQQPVAALPSATVPVANSTAPAPGTAPPRPARVRLRLWVDAIREAYVSLLPITVMGALAVALQQMASQWPATWLAAGLGAALADMSQGLINATMGVTGLLGSMAIAVRTSERLRATAQGGHRASFTVAAVAGASFLVLVLSTQSPHFTALGYSSIFQSILVGIATAELMAFFGRHVRIGSELRDFAPGLPLHQALNLTAAGALSMLTIAAVAWPTGVLGRAVWEVFNSLLVQALDPTWLHAGWLNPLIAVVNQMLWLVGINGGQFLLHVATLDVQLIADAKTLYSPEAASTMLVNAFGHLGGAGATLGLLLYTLWRIRDASLRRLAWWSLLPAVLNVNELLLFGIPLVMGRTLALPFVLAPLANTVLVMLALQLGWLTMGGAAVAWSTPIFLSGYWMSDSWVGVAVQVLALGMSAAIYAPFLHRLEHQRMQANQRAMDQAIAEMLLPAAQERLRFTERADRVGDAARSLVRDFREDLLASPQVPSLQVYYQPQHAADGTLYGVESLLRWRHASHGPIPTQAIVTLAEESALIHTLGRWVLERVCQDMQAWQAQGIRGVKVSVNLSPIQLEDPGWADFLERMLRRYGVDAQDIAIELTEGQSVSASAQSDHNIRQMQHLGVGLSMDDFGMGCTSLLYLHRFHIHEIKFDGVLTRTLEGNQVAQDIIACVTQLAHAQNAKVVAEFVERPAQRDILVALGCDYLQGWLYSPALSRADLVAYVLARQAPGAAPAAA